MIDYSKIDTSIDTDDMEEVSYKQTKRHILTLIREQKLGFSLSILLWSFTAVVIYILVMNIAMSALHMNKSPECTFANTDIYASKDNGDFCMPVNKEFYYCCKNNIESVYSDRLNKEIQYKRPDAFSISNMCLSIVALASFILAITMAFKRWINKRFR